MKTVKLLMVAIISIVSVNLFAQSTKTDSVRVNGNCGMCKKTIEKAAKGDGVSEAIWNKDTKMLLLTYDASKTSSDEVEKRIAASGYDTEKFKATDEAYNKLEKCCQYDRENPSQK
ncbi:MAG: copper chaperone [Chitinophagaceae bacterium]|jgi:copper chaperone CopZ|nr:copper chaperone [Chitinophagaceae bacterium]